MFRQKGYDGVTIDDLVVEMGVGRPSLYSIFGSKRKTFCAFCKGTPFSDAFADGELPADFPVAVRASQVLDLVRGLTMRAPLGTSRKKLLNDAKAAADLVLRP